MYKWYDYPSEYNSWKSMKQRCSNPNEINYGFYGGRGIQYCNAWETFEGFMQDMGPKPDKTYSIDRINSNGHYEKSNCRWADRATQRANQKPRVKKIRIRKPKRITYLTYNGETLSRREWAKKQGIKYETLVSRIKAGWSLDRALTK